MKFLLGMPLTPKLVSIGVSYSLFALSIFVGAGEVRGPDARWVRVYGWVQIGENLAGAQQWPLALGSYLEAEFQLKILMRTAPNFEPEMVKYRFDWLKNEIPRVKKKLIGDEHDIMEKYLDFISSFEQGQSERFDNQFEKALSTLNYAKVLLDELIAERPAEFRMVMKSQHDLLLDSIDWLNSQLNYRAALTTTPAIVSQSNLGTTRFVSENDLPAEASPLKISGDLFPSTMVDTAVTRFGEKSGKGSAIQSAGEDVSSLSREDQLPTFRMSIEEKHTPVSD